MITNFGTPVAVGPTNATGVAVTVPRSDHVHEGVHSISEVGQPQLFGDVTLSEGDHIALTQVLNDIEIAVVIDGNFLPDVDCTRSLGEDVTPLRWNGAYLCNLLHIENVANQNAIVIGDTNEEGGDIIVYEDAVGNISFQLDADASSLQLSDPDTELGDFTIYGKNGTVLSLGDATHEGGDIVVYQNAAGAIQFQVDADGTIAVTLGGDLDLAGNALLLTNFSIRQYDVNTIWIANRAGTSSADLCVDDISCGQIEGLGILSIYPSLSVGRRTAIWARKTGVGAAWHEVATAQNDGTFPWFEIHYAGDITMLDQKMMQFGTYTNAQRPAPGTAGRWIFNTDDGMPNYDDGTNWRDINGNIT